MSTPATMTEQLRAAIVTGRYQPGERLVESDLMRDFEVARRVVRDALAELQKEGLVTRTANRGASVRKITLDEAIEITEARALLEGLLAAQAAERASDDERVELSGLLTRMREAAATDPIGQFPPLYREFHQRVRAIGRHKVAAELVDILRNRNAQFQFRTALMPGRVQQSLEEHEAIVQAIVERDPAAAQQAMHAHLDAVVDALRAWPATSAVV